MTTYLYVEGGGDGKLLQTACERGFAAFLENSGFKGKMPRIVSCGSRGKAFDRFKSASEMKDDCLLLVDSEEFVSASSPWSHLKNRNGDGWEKPASATDDQCHLMVVCMESWLLSDRPALAEFFGQGFKEAKLPVRSGIEGISKSEVYKGLQEASKDCKTRAPYDKGMHSFKILAMIDPSKVVAESPWAGRFIKSLKALHGVELS